VRVESHEGQALSRIVAPPGLELRVRELLARMPGEARSARDIAGALGMPPRAMRERLIAEGISFTELADTARKRHALLLLESPHLRVEDVAACVGYTRVQNFARAFRRWTGQSPIAYRRATGSLVPAVKHAIHCDVNSGHCISIFDTTPE
jgi:AraC-like DNA-binding protein